MVADPGHRQIGQRLIVRIEAIEGDRQSRGGNQIVERQHHALRPPRRSRGIGDHRQIVAASLGNLGREKAGMRRIERAALLLHGIKRCQIVLRIMPETARILVDDALQKRQSLLDADQLVDLFLVLHHREARLRVIEHEHHLLGHGVLVDRHRHGAEALGCQHRPIELRPVVADDGDLVAALQAECREAAGDGSHVCRRVGPVPGLPDAESLLAHRRPIAAELRVLQHKLREGIVGRMPRALSRAAIQGRQHPQRSPVPPTTMSPTQIPPVAKLLVQRLRRAG